MNYGGERQLYIIMDQGGHASRAVVMDESGRPLAEAERALETSRTEGGFVEHDPRELVRSVRETLAEIAQKSGGSFEKIKAAGLATQRSSIVCWDKHTGEALSPVISWQDTRARERIIQLAHRAGEVHERTGLFLSAHYGASKLAWCVDNIPEVKKALDAHRLCFGPMSSFLVWQLTEEKLFVSDPVSASRTLLWNLHRKEWDSQLLEMFNIPSGALPTCVPTTHNFGNIKTGDRRIPLALVTGDQSAAMYAYGKLQPETAYMNIGTGAFVSRPLGQQPLLAPGLLTSVINQQGGISDYVLEGTINGAGSAVEWLREAHGTEDLWEQMPGWLRTVVDPPLFLNGISGLGAPFWVPDFVSGFVGNGQPHEKFVAVVESVVFLLHRNVVEMGLSLKGPEKIQVTGGLAAQDGICQRLADLTRISVFRPAQTEATVRGTCYLLAGRPDRWPEPAPGVWFEPGDGTLITQRYGKWVEEMEKRINSGK